MEDDSLSVIINSHYNTNLNETAFFFLYITFSQLFLFTEMIRGDKNDLISLAVLLFLAAVYAHHQQTLLACCACWPQCMIAVSHNLTFNRPGAHWDADNSTQAGQFLFFLMLHRCAPYLTGSFSLRFFRCSFSTYEAIHSDDLTYPFPSVLDSSPIISRKLIMLMNFRCNTYF